MIAWDDRQGDLSTDERRSDAEDGRHGMMELHRVRESSDIRGDGGFDRCMVIDSLDSIAGWTMNCGM